MSNPNDLTRLLFNNLANTALVNAAQSGGYDPNWIPDGTSAPRRKTGFLDIARYGGALLGGLANMRQVGIIPAVGQAISNAAGVKGQRDYNQYMQNQAFQAARNQLEQQKQQGKLYETVDPRFSGMERVSASDIAVMAPLVGNQDFGKAALDYQGGGYPKSFGLAPAAQVQQLTGDLLKRQGDVSDANALLQKMPGIFGEGQQGSFSAPQQRRQGFTSELYQQAPPGQPQLEPMNAGQPTLQGGVGRQAVEAPTVNPYFMGVPPVQQIVDLFKSGVGDSQDNREQAETQRSNMADEKTSQYKADTDRMTANEQKRRGYWTRPSGGSGSGNPYTIPNAQQNYLQGQVKAIDQELQSLGYLDKKTGRVKDPGEGSKGFSIPIPGPGNNLVLGASGPDTSAKAQRARELIQQRQQIQNAILPFGGQSTTKIQQAGANAGGFGAWKQNRGN